MKGKKKQKFFERLRIGGDFIGGMENQQNVENTINLDSSETNNDASELLSNINQVVIDWSDHWAPNWPRSMQKK